MSFILLARTALACFAAMPLTLDEIIGHEKRARREIAERECLLAALKVLRGYAEQGDTPASTEGDTLIPIPFPFTFQLAWKELDAPLQAAPETPPAPMRPPPYMHPELKAIGGVNGSSRMVVEWAISRMTDDYTVRDLAALLIREGRPMQSDHISLILARMKNRGEIEQLKPSSGATPAVYRKAADANPRNEESDAAMSSASSEC
jgi:hypothetical protein